MDDQSPTRGETRPGFSLVFPLLFGAVLAASGCTTGSTGSAAPVSEVSSTSTAPEPSHTTSASPQPSSSVPPSPANGTDVNACTDAACEIIVRGAVNIPLDQRFGFTNVIVTYIAPNTLKFDGDDPINGNAHTYIEGTGYMQLNGVTITVEGYDESGAIIRFTPPV